MIDSMLSLFLVLLEIFILSLTLPGSIELFALTAAALCRNKTLLRHKTINPPVLPRLAVVMPAHNEAGVIAACIENLQVAIGLSSGCELVVIADNCQDDTAEVAKAAGARVLIRHDDQNRGKGYALDYAFTKLLTENYDGFIVIDADSRVDAQLFTEFQLAFAQGIDALQCRYRSHAPNCSTVPGWPSTTCACRAAKN